MTSSPDSPPLSSQDPTPTSGPGCHRASYSPAACNAPSHSHRRPAQAVSYRQAATPEEKPSLVPSSHRYTPRRVPVSSPPASHGMRYQHLLLVPCVLGCVWSSHHCSCCSLRLESLSLSLNPLSPGSFLFFFDLRHDLHQEVFLRSCPKWVKSPF